MPVMDIGCCGAYCKTCPAYRENACSGCKHGYADKTRDIKKAKCNIKACCIRKGNNTCSDCRELSTCTIINGFYDKNSYKYKKYKQAITFIRERGYDEFIRISDKWKSAYGKYE